MSKSPWFESLTAARQLLARAGRVLTPQRRAMYVSALWVALIPGSAMFAYLQIHGYAGRGMIGVDSHAYWAAARDPSSWYTRPPAHWDAYLYSPAFAQALWPLGQLPWRVFQVIWMVAQLLTLAWLLAPLGWRRALTITGFVVPELVLGNVYIFYAAALVLMLRRAPGVVAFPLLTKVFPGIVGLWFVVRREWRAVGWAALSSVLIVAVSAAFTPQAWLAWLRFLTTSAHSGDGGVAMVRFVISAGIVVWAGLRGRAWLLAPALILASPVLGAYSNLTVLTALPLLFRLGREHVGEAGELADHVDTRPELARQAHRPELLPAQPEV